MILIASISVSFGIVKSRSLWFDSMRAIDITSVSHFERMQYFIS